MIVAECRLVFLDVLEMLHVERKQLCFVNIRLYCLHRLSLVLWQKKKNLLVFVRKKITFPYVIRKAHVPVRGTKWLLNAHSVVDGNVMFSCDVSSMNAKDLPFRKSCLQYIPMTVKPNLSAVCQSIFAIVWFSWWTFI